MSSPSTPRNNQPQTPALSKFLPKEQISGTPAAPQDPKVCLACYGEEELIDLPCDHTWCPSCITRASSLVFSERHWPMKCGEKCWIPEDLALEALPREEARSLKAKLEEFKIPERQRCYCANTQCNKFILPNFVNVDGNLARCGECSIVTCTMCYREQHEGLCAGPSEEEIQAIDLMKSQGYQKCTQCNRVVERTEGCPHMTCYCGYDFCYHCGNQINICNGCVHREPEFGNLIIEDDSFVPGFENHHMRVLEGVAAQIVPTALDINPDDHAAHLTQALIAMYAVGAVTATAQNTALLNLLMQNQGHRGPVIYIDAQHHALGVSPGQQISDAEQTISDQELWQSYRATNEMTEVQLEQDEIEWQRMEEEYREEQRAIANTWREDWSM